MTRIAFETESASRTSRPPIFLKNARLSLLLFKRTTNLSDFNAKAISEAVPAPPAPHAMMTSLVRIDIVSRAAHVRDDCYINGSRYRASILRRKNPNGESAGGFSALVYSVHNTTVSSSGQNDRASYYYFLARNGDQPASLRIEN
jgi:hypothetical protein